MLALAVVLSLSAGQTLGPWSPTGPILMNPARMDSRVFIAPLLTSTSPVMRPAGTAVTTTRSGTAYDVDGSNVVQSCAANTGCFNATKGLASHSARTNQWTNSTALGSATDIGTPTVTAGVASGPFATVIGSAEVDELVDDDAAAIDGKEFRYNTPGNAAFMMACSVAAGETGTTKNNVRLVLATAGGSVSGTCACQFTDLVSGTYARKSCGPCTTAGGPVYLAGQIYLNANSATTGSIRVSECEIYAASAEMPPCPSDATARTCAADTHTVPSTGWPTGSGEIGFRYTALSSAAPASQYSLFDSRTTATTSGVNVRRNTSNAIALTVYDGSGLICTCTSSALTWATEKQIEVRWSPAGCEVWADGVSVASSAVSGNMTAHNATAWIGTDRTGTLQSNGWTRDLCVGRQGACP